MGTFYGVGLGPGDPELLTVKAVRVLTEVDWIFVPVGRTGASFAGRIVAGLKLPQEKFRPVSLCMARDRSDDQRAYRCAAEEIAFELRQGKSAAWISEGDPLFYSTFANLYEEMRLFYPQATIEIVPGVTSLQAAAARVGWPVAKLDDRVAIVPAAYGLQQLPELLRDFACIFLVKVNTVFDELLTVLKPFSGLIRAAYLENVGTPQERVVTDLPSLRDQELSYFSLVLIKACTGVPSTSV